MYICSVFVTEFNMLYCLNWGVTVYIGYVWLEVHSLQPLNESVIIITDWN